MTKWDENLDDEGLRVLRGTGNALMLVFCLYVLLVVVGLVGAVLWR